MTPAGAGWKNGQNFTHSEFAALIGVRVEEEVQGEGKIQVVSPLVRLLTTPACHSGWWRSVRVSRGWGLVSHRALHGHDRAGGHWWVRGS